MNVRHILGISGGKDSAALALCGDKYEIVLKGKSSIGINSHY